MTAAKETADTTKKADRTDWPRVDAASVHARLGGTAELAFLDVREEGLFNTGHPLTIVSAPFSHLETRLAALVPRRSTPIVLMGPERRRACRARGPAPGGLGLY